MKLCKYCGTENDSSSLCCSNCGKMLEDETYYSPNVHYGTASVGWWFIGFINFIAGFILAGVLANKMPDAASKAKSGAIVGVICNVLFLIVYFCMMGSALGLT